VPFRALFARILAVTTRAKELFEASVDQVRHGQLRPALGTLLDALAVDPTHSDALEAASKICRMLGATEDALLFEALRDAPGDADALYSLGYRLVDQTRPDVAIALFERGLRSQPSSGTSDSLRRELAFAQFANRDFEACMSSLGALENQLELAEAERLDLHLLQAEAALYLFRRDVALHFLAQAEEIISDDGQRARMDALHALVGRSNHWPRLGDAGLRAWHFIQTGGVLLKTAGGYFEDGSRAGRYGSLDLRADMVAFLLQRLVHLFERLGIDVETVIPTSPTAAPLAQALARRMGRTFVESLADRSGRTALVVAAGAGEFEPLSQGFARHRTGLHLFSVNLDWSRDNAVLPEVAGILASRAFLPWETRYALDPDTHEMREVQGDERPSTVIGAELVELMDALPDDGGKARAEFEDFYVPKTDQLVLANEGHHPYRRQFTHISPCWKPVGKLNALAGTGEDADGASYGNGHDGFPT
jgi:tetratricopeptide (TPR) repeat protein